MEHLDDLVRSATSGDGRAFGLLWERLSPLVAGYLRGRGASEPDDLTSDVFLAAFRRMGRFDGDGAAFRRWVFTIAHHRLVDDLRRRRSRGVSVPYEPDADPRSSVSAEDVALDGLGDGEVGRLLGLLTEDQREVLVLRVVGELSLAEVADVLGKPLTAVKSLQHRGLERLRRETLPVPVSRDGTDPMTGAR